MEQIMGYRNGITGVPAFVLPLYFGGQELRYLSMSSGMEREGELKGLVITYTRMRISVYRLYVIRCRALISGRPQ